LKPSPGKVVFVFFLLAALFLILLNWPAFVTGFLQPISMVVWLVLRTFVLSVDQQYYWWALILVIIVFLFRLVPRVNMAEEPTPENSLNETLRSIQHWRSMYIPDENSRFHDQFLKREFVHLLVTMYAAREHVAADFHLHEQLRQGEIYLPEGIRSYLFCEDPFPEPKTWKTVTKSILNAPRRWWNESRSRKREENDRKMEEILTFFETSLEIDHVDK